MKSHDFGQFIFNSSILSKSQIYEIIKSAKQSEPTLAVEALFLRLINSNELIREDDEFVRTLITPRQEKRAEELKDGQSVLFAQALVDNGIANFSKLGRIIDEYSQLEIPPIETALTNYYDKLKNHPDVDFPFAVDIFQRFHNFLSETFNSTIIILPPSNSKNKLKLGASVKIVGEIPAVVSLLADEKIFFDIAKRYESYVEMMT